MISELKKLEMSGWRSQIGFHKWYIVMYDDIENYRNWLTILDCKRDQDILWMKLGSFCAILFRRYGSMAANNMLTNVN